jgi:hypothetical protein
MFMLGARKVFAAGVVVFIGVVPAACIFAPIDYSREGDGACSSTVGCLGSTECRTVTCPGVTCGATNDSPDKVIGQTDHDCAKRQCDGNGGVVILPDPGDLPEDDLNPCTIEDCDDSTPLNAPAGAACPNGACDGQGHCSTCDDGQRNGNETDVDCGGPDCPHCDGEACSGSPMDCQSGHCVDGVCCTTACDKKCDACEVSFTGVPSGMCAPVLLGQQHGSSCTELGGCGVQNLCACEDGVQNQTESAVDCGGICAAGCGGGVPCTEPLDCKSGICLNNVCG